MYNIVVGLCQFFGSGGKEFSCDLRKILIGFFIIQKQLDNQGIFLIISELSNTAYIFLALYGSTTLQSR